MGEVRVVRPVDVVLVVSFDLRLNIVVVIFMMRSGSKWLEERKDATLSLLEDKAVAHSSLRRHLCKCTG